MCITVDDKTGQVTLCCPFFNPSTRSCEVSTSGSRVHPQRQRRLCLTDDHDVCVTYLCYLYAANFKLPHPCQRQDPCPTD